MPGTALCVPNKITSYNLKAVVPNYEYQCKYLLDEEIEIRMIP